MLRTTESSLCGNTGAIGVILVDGRPQAFGDLTAVGRSVQAEANPGDHVVATVFTVPLFNEIACVRLGELRVQLDECDLVGFSAGISTQLPCVLPCEGVATRDWYAWNNKMPPKPDDFHIVGEVDVPNPGVDAELVPRVPQGTNPDILMLNLVLTQRPGIWPRVITPKQVRYDRVLVNSDYTEVHIFCGDEVIAEVPVEDVH